MNFIQQLPPKKASLFGSILSILFFLIFLILGFLQPGYNHIRDTVSELVLGKHGWIQTINFGILIISTILVILSFEKYINSKKNFTKMAFWICIFEMIIVLLCPVAGKTLKIIHYTSTFILIITITLMILSVIQDMKSNSHWKKFVLYSYFVLLFNFINGMIWFYFKKNGILFEWKGLFQKIIILNALIWLSSVGIKLWKLEKK